MRRNLLLTAVVIGAVVLARLGPKPPPNDSEAAAKAIGRGRPSLNSDVDETFLYDVAARFNEAVVANIDAVDTALTTILAGDVAVLVLTIDKIKELAPTHTAWALALMSFSTSACVVGYMLGFSVRASKRDGVRPRMAIPDLLERPSQAITAAVIDLVTSGEQNLTMRSVKKGLAVLAILSLLAGAVVIALARANGDVVY